MRVVMFYPSLIADWNNGHAHFLRGVAGELTARGHAVAIYEPQQAWSVRHLIEDVGMAPPPGFARHYPGLASHIYDPARLDLDAALDGADLVIVHEWTKPELVARLGAHRARSRYTLLFHDPHHRAVSDPASLEATDLSGFDGVLAFGRVLAEIYEARGWARKAWVWHEAADVRVFEPLPGREKAGDLVWVGNWGDGERSAELHEFLIEPVAALGLAATVHGVRYPEHARAALAASGIAYGGYLPNYRAPELFARHRVTVHVPRRPYARALPGIPTIRPFEALACGIPLVSAPWDDAEGLFTPGRDYLVARNGAEMREHLGAVLSDAALASELAAHGRQTILARHTCGHRVDELMTVVAACRGVPAG